MVVGRTLGVVVFGKAIWMMVTFSQPLMRLAAYEELHETFHADLPVMLMLKEKT